MYYIEKFNNNLFVCGEGHPQWVGKIDSRQSFGTVYSGWYTEPDVLRFINNTATSETIFAMDKMIYRGDYAYGYRKDTDELYEINYTDINAPIYTKYDIEYGAILDICLNDDDPDSIYVVTGSGILEADQLDIELHKYDISTPTDATHTEGPITFTMNDYPYSDSSEEEVVLEFANILSLGTDIYVMFTAVGETKMQPWLETTQTQTCKFLYKGAYDASTIDLSDNTPPMPTIGIDDSYSLHASKRRAVTSAIYDDETSEITLSMNIGTIGDNYAYEGIPEESYFSRCGNFGFHSDSDGLTDTRFNTVKNTLCIVGGVVACTLNFDSGSICKCIVVNWMLFGNAFSYWSYPNLYDVTDKAFTYFITEDNSIDNLLDHELTGEQQEMFGTTGAATVGIRRRSPHYAKYSSGNWEFSISDYNNETMIRVNYPTTDSINIDSIQVSNTEIINDSNLIFDVISVTDATDFILTAHRNYGTLGIGNYNVTSGVGVLTLSEATLSGAFDINDSDVTDEVFDKNIKYKYKLSCLYDEFQEGPLSNIYLSPNDHSGWSDFNNIISIGITISIQPASIPSKRISHINLYRSDGDAYYRLVKSIPVEDFHSNDAYYEYSLTDDGSLLASFDSINGYSQEMESISLNYDLMTQFNGYLYTSGVTLLDGENARNYLFRSKPGRYSIFDWSNDYVKTDFEIDIIKASNGDILVANENNMAIIDSEQMYVKKYIHGIGCNNQDLIKDTPYGLVFVGNNTIYIWDGKQLHDIGIAISHGANSLDDVTIEKMEYDSELKKIYLFGVFDSTDLNYFSYSFEEKRWDMGEDIDSGTGATVTGSFIDHKGKVYFTYNIPIDVSTYWDGTDPYGDFIEDVYIDA